MLKEIFNESTDIFTTVYAVCLIMTVCFKIQNVLKKQSFRISLLYLKVFI